MGLVVGYNTLQTDKATMDVLAGVRYLGIDLDAELDISGPLPPGLPGKKLSESVDLWDGVVGIKGHYDLNDRWYLPYYLDIGTGSSDLTWQAVGGIGYRFKWGGFFLAYRHLYYDEDSSKILQDLEFSGPALGVNFRF